MAKSKLVNIIHQAEDFTVGGYKQIENFVVGSYKQIEQTVVTDFLKVTDYFIDHFLVKEYETLEEAKERLKQEQISREKAAEEAHALRSLTQEQILQKNMYIKIKTGHRL